jgi:hypothetical protein
MSPENFVYWLSGFFEVSQHSDSPKVLNEKQTEEIQNHLNLVLSKVTPELFSPRDTQVIAPHPTIFPQVYCGTTDFSQLLSGPIGETIACGADNPTFLEQFKIDEEERKKRKTTQPYSNPNREPGRAC